MLNSDHPWTHVYAPGATWSAPLHAMPVPQLLTNTAARWPDQAALRFEGRTFSYAELDALTDRMAQGLRRIGVLRALEAEGFQPGDEIEIAGVSFELDPSEGK